jgi:hypothetical protein
LNRGCAELMSPPSAEGRVASSTDGRYTVSPEPPLIPLGLLLGRLRSRTRGELATEPLDEGIRKVIF